MTVHDGTYSIDYMRYRFPQPEDDDVSECDRLSASSSVSDATLPPAHIALANHVVTAVRKYRKPHDYKISAGAITTQAQSICPSLPALLWKELDIVCFVFEPFFSETAQETSKAVQLAVDEESDSVVRKTIE